MDRLSTRGRLSADRWEDLVGKRQGREQERILGGHVGKKEPRRIQRPKGNSKLLKHETGRSIIGLTINGSRSAWGADDGVAEHGETTLGDPWIGSLRRGQIKNVGACLRGESREERIAGGRGGDEKPR